MKDVVPYTKFRNTSSFIREAIEMLLKREDEQPTGWSVHRRRA
jgi:Arc/MetJ-type ribon-helix-helix transcriptional regulator